LLSRAIDLKKIKPRRNQEHEERKNGKSLKRLNFSSPLRALGALRGEILFLDFYKTTSLDSNLVTSRPLRRVAAADFSRGFQSTVSEIKLPCRVSDT
jgi:hypothetical protein